MRWKIDQWRSWIYFTAEPWRVVRSTYDKYVGTQVDMTRGVDKAQGTVVCRVTDNMGHLKGRTQTHWSARPSIASSFLMAAQKCIHLIFLLNCFCPDRQRRVVSISYLMRLWCTGLLMQHLQWRIGGFRRWMVRKVYFLLLKDVNSWFVEKRFVTSDQCILDCAKWGASNL